MASNYRRKVNGLMSMSSLIQKLTKTTLLRRGIHRHQILLDWQVIVGDRLATLSCPVRITRPKDAHSGGTLHLQVLSGASLLIDSSKDLITERINRYYGYRIVERLKIIQTPTLGTRKLPKKAAPQKKASTPLAPAFLETLNGISDPDLQQALKEFSETFQSR